MRLFTLVSAVLLAALPAYALGEAQILQFESTSRISSLPLVTDLGAIPIITDRREDSAVQIASNTFAEDVYKVTKHRPEVYHDVRPNMTSALIVGTVDSALLKRIHRGSNVNLGNERQQIVLQHEDLRGKWESYDIRVVRHPLPGLEEALVITGSDRRGAIYGLYTLSELIGVSPFHWWSDIPPQQHSHISFPHDQVLMHGEPTVKYRGFFLNDEQPVLWNWARDHFREETKGGPPFQVGMYERMFELLLRLKGNYMWPAMWESKFAVDGLDTLPDHPIPGPNQLLAEKMGVIMGTSHHEPMSRNQKEYTDHGSGAWSWLKNGEFLSRWWRYGAERAKGLDTLFTLGMRGDGDLELPEATVEVLQDIVKTQQKLLRDGLNKTNLHGIPQTWAMYKEVMKFFAEGLEVPPDVTPLLSDDNWGNLMAVMPNGSHPAGGGIYYHADYVGDPRNYKWINTVSLPKMWEQLNLARSMDTHQIWILNVGDLKFLELPLEYFMSLSYDFDRWNSSSLLPWLEEWARRDFGPKGIDAEEVAEIMALYTMYASRRKAELVDSSTFSLLNYDEANRIQAQWQNLEDRAFRLTRKLEDARSLSFYESVLLPIKLQRNLNDLYISAAKSNLYATQGRTAANVFADHARECLEKDHELTESFHQANDGKWNHMLAQPHFNYQYWQSPVREALPPISYVSSRRPSYDHGNIIHTRFIVENWQGAWPGDGKYNCQKGYACPDPTVLPMDPWGQDRWVEVASGGPDDIDWKVETSHEWLSASPREGRVTGDGRHDTRVTISVDWGKLRKRIHTASKEGAGGDVVAHAVFRSSDGATMNLTLPIHLPTSPPDTFHGAIEGDGYVVIEAAHHQGALGANHHEHNTGTTTHHAWTEVPYYGRTLSGTTILPVHRHLFVLGQGPSLDYNFWIHSAPGDGTLNLTLVIGPTLNYVLGERIAFGVSLDGGRPITVKPVPVSTPGALPPDWVEVVSNEVREVKVQLGGVERSGEHKLTIWGVTAGIVLERVIVDMGGIKARGYSYLGPPESIIR